MSKIIQSSGLLRCTVQSHETQILDQVCVEETCANRGLQCERCIRQSNNNNNHTNHHVISLPALIEQYRDSTALSNYSGELTTEQKQLQTVQNDIKMHLQNLLTTLQQHVKSTIDRLNIQFENDLQAFNALIQAEQKYTTIIADLEKKNYTNAADAKKKVNDLLQRVTLNEKKRLVIMNINTEASQKAKQALCVALSAKDNVAQETTNIANDAQTYLDGLFRYVSGVKNNNNSSINGLNENNQGGRKNNFGNSLQPQQSSLNHGPTFGAHSMMSSSSNNNQNIIEDQSQVLVRPLQGAASYNQRPNAQAALGFSQQNQLINNTNQILPLHEFERNNENSYSRAVVIPNANGLKNSNNAVSPFREEINIVSANSKVNNNKPMVQSYFLGNSNNNYNNPSNNNSNNNSGNFQDVNDSSFIPQEGKVERSYSLTNNIGKANSKSMGSPHVQYFQEPQLSVQQQPTANSNNVQQSQLLRTAIGPNMAVSNAANQQQFGSNSINNYNSIGMVNNQLSNSNSLMNGRLVQSNNNFMFGDGNMNQMLGQNTARTNGNRVWWKAHDGPVRDIVFIDGDKVASGGDDGRVKLWERIEGRLLISLLGHTRGITCLAYHSGARILLSGSEDKTIKVWRPVPTWQCVGTLKGNGDTVSALSFLNESLVVSGCLDGKIRVYDLEKGGISKYMSDGDSSKVRCLLSLGNNRLLAGQRNMICVWDTITGLLVRKEEAHSGQVVSLLHVKGRRGDQQQLIISCSKDSQVKLWDASSLTLLRQFVEIFPIADIAYVSDIDALAVSLIPIKQNQAYVSLWSLTTLKKVFQLAENNSVANKLLYDHTLKLFYSAHDNQFIQYTKIAQ